MNYILKNAVFMYFLGKIYFILYYYKDTKYRQKLIGKIMRYYAEYLGPTFIKICQSLTHRTDLLHNNTVNELKPLLKDCTPENNLEEKLQEQFTNIKELKLIGSGSIAQVYSGFINNKKYAFKIKRTNIDEQMNSDIYVIERWLNIINYFYPYYRIYNRFQQFKNAILIQTNFSTEIKNNLLFQKAVKKLPNIEIVKIHTELSTNNIIVMDYIEGKTLSENTTLTNITLIHQIVKLWFNTLFDYNIIHGDLHYGNIIINNDKLFILDFGLVFNIKPKIQIKFMEYLKYCIELDKINIYEWLLNNYIDGDKTEIFKIELMNLIEKYIIKRYIRVWDFGKEIDKLLLKYKLFLNEEYIELEISQATSGSLMKSLNNDPKLLKSILHELDIF